MSNKKQSIGIGEIGTIRDILMGEHIANFETQFQAVQNKMEQMADKYEAALKALEKKHAEELSMLRNNMEAQIAQLRKQVEEKTATVSKQVEDTSETDKHDIGQLLIEMGKQLKGLVEDSEE